MAVLDRSRARSLITAWPNQTEAARMLRVNEATLLRRNRPFASFGGREKRFSPTVILEETVHFQRVPVQEVAAELERLARKRGGRQLGDQIARELDLFIEKMPTAPVLSPAEFLREAQRTLPRGVYMQVRDIYQQRRPEPRRSGLLARAVKAAVRKVPAAAARVRRKRRLVA